MQNLRFLLACLVLGCGPSAPLDAGLDAGEPDAGLPDAGIPPRLQLVQWQAEGGGAAYPVAFFDPELDANCVPRTTEDGQTRCVPEDFGYLRLYADPGCAQPALPGCSSSPTVSVVENVECSSVYRAYRRGEPLPQAYRLDGDTCVPSTEMGVSLTRIPDEALVAGSLVVEPALAGERLSQRVYVMADGSRLPTRTRWDSTLETACGPARVPGEQWPCVPSGWPAFNAGACGLVARLPRDSACQPRDFYVTEDYGRQAGPFCRVAALEVYARGPELDASEAMTCNGIDPNDDLAHSLVRESSIATIASDLEPGEGRLRRYPDARFSAPYRDTELGIDCEPREVDGVPRCIPWAGTSRGWPRVSSIYFEDASCAVRVGVVAVDDECAEWFVDRAPGECVAFGLAAIHRATGRLDTVYRRADDGRCELYESEDGVFFSLEAVPFERFAPMESVRL